LKRWRAARTAPPGAPRVPGQPSVPRDPAEKRSERQLAHNARITEYVQRLNIADPRDPVELLRLARSVFINCLDDQMEFSDDEMALFQVIREYIYLQDGHTSALEPAAD
jgi:hypothetical protein